MINKHRFITEYRNYIINDLKRSDISKQTLIVLTVLADKYISACHAGLISVNECMYKLVTICSNENVWDHTGENDYD